mgnify:CR=1 FL=1
MSAILALIFLASANVPSGPACLSQRETEQSPLATLPASFESISTVSGSDGDKVLILVADYLSDPLAASLAQFQSDISSDGWTVEMQIMNGGTVEDIKFIPLQIRCIL